MIWLLLALPEAYGVSVCSVGCDYSDLATALANEPRPTVIELQDPGPHDPVEIRGDVTIKVEVDATVRGDPGFAAFDCNPSFLFAGLLDVCDGADLTVLDSGGRLTLDGQGSEMGVTAGTNASVWLEGVDLTRGSSNFDGAGALTASDSRAVTLVDVTAFDNEGDFGGALALLGVADVWIEASALELGSGFNYGGLINADGVDRFTLLDSSVQRGDANYGGCMRLANVGAAEITGSVIEFCSAGAFFAEGGGVYQSQGSLDVTDSRITGTAGSAGGAVWSDTSAPVTFTSTVLSGDAGFTGGAVHFQRQTPAAWSDSVICDSSAAIGGGIFTSGHLDLANVGFIGVTATQDAHAATTTGTMAAVNVTVRASGNGGGNLFEADQVSFDALVVDGSAAAVFGPTGAGLTGAVSRLNLSNHAGAIVSAGSVSVTELSLEAPQWMGATVPRCSLELRLHPESPAALVGDPDDVGDDLGMFGGASVGAAAVDADGDGAPWALDCDEADPAVSAPLVETCNAVDDDCDEVIDEGEPGLLGALGYLDEDGDGIGGLPACSGVLLPDGGDCDDSDPAVPLPVELCFDLVDNDCDGLTELEQPAYGEVLWGIDADGDGYTVQAVSACLRPTDDHVLLTTAEEDCDDLRADVYPGAVEVCDGVDNDCDQAIDDNDPSVDRSGSTAWYADADGDGYVSAVGEARCAPLDGWSSDPTGALDCNDTDGSVAPGAVEACNGVDDDCDGLVDDDDPQVVAPAWGPDVDGDGFAKVLDDVGLLRCEAPGDDWALTSGPADCNDSDAAVNPDAIEVPGDPVDEDCDGLLACFEDADGDLHGGQVEVAVSVATGCRDGAAYSSDDCDDGDAFVYPGAAESPADGVDSDCDGQERCYLDADGDGFGGLSTVPASLACDEPGVVAVPGDCNDLDPTRRPDAVEVEGDGVDQDCDGVDQAPEAAEVSCGCQATSIGWGPGMLVGVLLMLRRRRWVVAVTPALAGCPVIPAADIDARIDLDGDGVVGLAAGGADCDDQRAWVYPGAFDAPYDGIDADCRGDDDFDADGDGFPRDVDCDDRSATVYPGATERWYDGRDQDCDGLSDYDQDGDGFTVEQAGGGDCDDLDPLTHPLADDLPYDGVDTDCRGDDDFDADGDGAASADHIDPSTGELGTDCDDDDPQRTPDAVEWCNGYDDDCDEVIDGPSSIDATLRFRDADGDGFGDSDDTQIACVHGAGWILVGGDCDDAEPTTYPGAPDAWYDGVDSDCAGNNDCDRDGDGFAAANGAFCKGLDCGDDDEEVGPDAGEVPFDGLDNNCDDEERTFIDIGLAETRIDGDVLPVASGLGLSVMFADVDGDGSRELLTTSDSAGDGAELLVFGPPPLGQVTPADTLARVALPTAVTGFTFLHHLRAPMAAADVVGDEGVEVFVGRPFSAAGGEVVVVSGALGVPTTHRLWAGPSDRFGHDLVLPGDVDLDGYDDLVVGAPEADGGRGAVWFIPGPLDEDRDVLVDEAKAVFGTSGAPIGGRVVVGDLDGDGVGDLVTRSRPEETDGDLVSIWFGIPGPVPWQGAAHLVIDLTPSSHAYVITHGIDVADIDGDRRDELLLTRNPYVEPVPGFFLTDLGQLLVFDGLEDEPLGGYLLASSAALSLTEIGAGYAPAGNDVLALPDMDGDGLSEVLWGMPLAGFPITYVPTQGALLYRGSTFADWLMDVGLPASPSAMELSITGPERDGLGRHLFAADLDGDGLLDVSLSSSLALGGGGSVVFVPAVGAL